MPRKKISSSSSGGGGAELFICFTSRSSTTTSSAAPQVPPPPPAAPPLSTSLSRGGGRSLKGGQSPMFPSTTTTSRRKGAAFEAAEPSSPKVTCIGQVRVKGGKRRKQQQQPPSGVALRSRSRRAVAAADSSFRRIENYDRECKSHSQGGWVYQIPVSICDALKTFGSELNCLLPCGGSGKSVCGSSRNVGDDDQKGKKRRKANGSWLCGATLARWLMAIEDEDDVGVKDGKVVGVLDEGEVRKVGLMMEGWAVEKEVEDLGLGMGMEEKDEKEEILVVGGKEEEGRVSVCIPPRNALLLMRCRSDPVRMAALATRFWGSPAGAPVPKGQVEDEEEEEEEGKAMKEVECDREKSQKVVVREGDEMLQDLDSQEDGAAAETVMEADPKDTEVEEIVKYEDLGHEEKMAAEEKEEGEEEEKGDEEGEIAKRDGILDSALAQVAGSEEKTVEDKTEMVIKPKKEAEKAKGAEKEGDEVKGRRSSSHSPSTAKEERKLSRSGSRKCSGYSVGREKGSRRHSFSTERDVRRRSFSSLKEAGRASFSINREGRRWSFSIEQEHLIAEPKIVMQTMKNRKCSPPEPEQEKGGDVVVLNVPNSEEDISQVEVAAEDQGKEDELAGKQNQDVESVEEEKKEENEKDVGGEEEEVLEEKEEKKNSGALPDCLMLMMYEPKLSMEVSKETWVCSTDFVHWQAYQGQSRRSRRLTKVASTADGSKAKDNTKVDSNNEVAEESNAAESVNSAPKMPAVPQAPPALVTMEQKVKLEMPVVTAAAYAPFVLKRCKSEPMRSSARLAPDACFWKDRHRPIGATGIGF